MKGSSVVSRIDLRNPMDPGKITHNRKLRTIKKLRNELVMSYHEEVTRHHLQ